MSLQVHACRSLTSPSASATRYIAPINGQAWTATEAQAAVLCTAAGTFGNFSVVVPSAPGVGKSLTFTLRINAVDTAAVIAISGTATSGVYTATAIALADGDQLSIKCVPSGTPAVSAPSICWDFQSTTPGESIYGLAWQGGGVLSINRTQRVLCAYDATNWDAATSTQEVVGCAGALTKATITLDVDVTASGSITFTITKNGVAQDGSGGTPDTRIIFATGTTTASATFTLPVSPGDLLTWTAVRTGSPASVRPTTGVRLLATTPGHSHVGGTYLQSLTAAGGTVYLAPGQGNHVAASATESDRTVTLGPTGLLLRNLHCQWDGNVGTTGARGWTLALRQNGADAGNSVALLGATSSGSNTSSTTFAAGDTLALQAVPVGTASSADPGWAWLQDQSAAEPGITGSVVFGVDTTVIATRAAAFGLDGNTNVHAEAGMLKVFGDFEVTGATTLEDLSVTGTFALPADSVTNAALADMAQATLKGRAAGAGTGDPTDLTGTQATVILDAMVGDSGSGGTKGLVPAPGAGDAAGNKFLKANGTWTAPAGTGDVVGPASAVDQEIALFDGTTGKLLERLTGTGFVRATSGVASVSTFKRTLGITIDGGGSVITTGVKGFISCPVAGTITKWRILSTDAAVTSGSVVMDVWRDSYANYPPTVADTITASAKPTLSSATKSEDAVLTGWSTSVSAGDVFGFNVDSVTTVTRVVLELVIEE
jgi:hypothetical protein